MVGCGLESGFRGCLVELGFLMSSVPILVRDKVAAFLSYASCTS